LASPKTWPFAEGQIGGDEDGSALVELADEVEQELTAGLAVGEESHSLRQPLFCSVFVAERGCLWRRPNYA
jgi:hypothetical protein